MHVILIGTIAQLVKMAPVLRELEANKIPHLFVLSGQHREVMDDLINVFGLSSPDDILADIGESDTIIKLLKWLKLAWRNAKNRDYFQSATSIVVHGDTVSTLLGAMIGRRRKIPVVHVEAGLRSFNYFHPFPEEIIRVLIARMPAVHFCPGEWAANNLARLQKKADHEVIDTRRNTLIDSLRFVIANKDNEAPELYGRRYAVASIRRFENLSNADRFDHIMKVLVGASKKIKLIFIQHPVTRLKLAESGMDKVLEKNDIRLLDRLDYVRFMKLLFNSRFLITDGGGNQEEAAYMGLPCLIMRKATERNEGVGKNAVLSLYDKKISEEFIAAHCRSDWKMSELPDYFPSRQIADYLSNNI